MTPDQETLSRADFDRANGMYYTVPHGGLFGLYHADDGLVKIVRFDSQDAAVVISKTGTFEAAYEYLQTIADELFQEYLKKAEADIPEAIRNFMHMQGYTLCHTGGGCLAWGRKLNEHESIMISDLDANLSAGLEDEAWCVTRSDDRLGLSVTVAPFTITEALRVAPAVEHPSQYDCEIVTPDEFYARHRTFPRPHRRYMH